MRPPAAGPAAARVARGRGAPGRLLGACLALLAAGCSACPPAWLSHPPEGRGALYATGSCGEVSVDADARHVALTRAARRIADRLGLDVEPRLSVVHADGRLFVEALTPSGPTDALDGLELVELAVCDEVTHVLVRLPARPDAPAPDATAARPDARAPGAAPARPRVP